MAYNFKNLADVELLDSMPSDANLLVEINGTTKRAPKEAKINVEAELSNKELLEEVPENAKALVEIDGAIKRVSGGALGGNNQQSFTMFHNEDNNKFYFETGDSLKIFSMIKNGEFPSIVLKRFGDYNDYYEYAPILKIELYDYSTSGSGIFVTFYTYDYPISGGYYNGEFDLGGIEN